jgi:hypothetical protein
MSTHADCSKRPAIYPSFSPQLPTNWLTLLSACDRNPTPSRFPTASSKAPGSNDATNSPAQQCVDVLDMDQAFNNEDGDLRLQVVTLVVCRRANDVYHAVSKALSSSIYTFSQGVPPTPPILAPILVFTEELRNFASGDRICRLVFRDVRLVSLCGRKRGQYLHLKHVRSSRPQVSALCPHMPPAMCLKLELS